MSRSSDIGLFRNIQKGSEEHIIYCRFCQIHDPGEFRVVYCPIRGSDHRICLDDSGSPVKFNNTIHEILSTTKECFAHKKARCSPNKEFCHECIASQINENIIIH